MDIERLNESMEKCISNNKDFEYFKPLYMDSLNSFIIKFDEYNLEPDYDNFYSRLSDLKVNYSNDIDTFVCYKCEENELLINIDKLKLVEDINILDNIFNRPILDMITYVKSLENEKFNKGITFDYQGKKMGNVINEKIDDRILELFFGNEESSNISLPTAKEEVYYDVEKLIDSENLLTYYLNGRGDLFLSKMSEIFPNEEECIDFIESSDKLENSYTENDKIYKSKLLNALKNKKENISFQTL